MPNTAIRKRGYSRAFRTRSEKCGRYLLDKIPPRLWRDAKAKARRDGISIRQLLLQRLAEYTTPATELR